MKIGLRRLSSLLILASALRCSHAPTEPLARPTPTPPLVRPTPTPAPPTIDLTGSWRGTFDTTGCPPNDVVQADISQHANSVGGDFRTQCAPGWSLVFLQGTLSSDNVLAIELMGGNEITIDKLEGKVSSRDIDLVHTTASRTTRLHLSR